MSINDKFAGYIYMEVTEVLLTMVTWDITHEMLEDNNCTTLEEFESKVRNGDIDLLDYNCVEMETLDAQISDIHPDTAKAERFPDA